jgi:hypothetical protein
VYVQRARVRLCERSVWKCEMVGEIYARQGLVRKVRGERFRGAVPIKAR